ncbi:tail fiber assembly protein [Shigella flexneri K-1770]|nr:tail fiber assembly protein [Shigella flexneri K-1770]
MLHLKNITAGNPKTAEQYQMTKRYSVTWLFSEDGKNWYEELKNFASDTIKIAYTGDGRVVWVGKDVTGIEPRNASVIEVPDITANRRITARVTGFTAMMNLSLTTDSKRKMSVMPFWLRSVPGQGNGKKTCCWG